MPGTKKSPPAAGSRELLRISGLAAVRARFARDPDSIQRLYFDFPTGKKIGMICRLLAAKKRIYRCVEPPELEKIASSVHHGGIVAVVPMPEWRPPSSVEVSRWVRERDAVLVLDRIGNAHNFGALARTAAFFGVQHLVFTNVAGAARPGDAAYRTAEGGLEELSLWQVPRVEIFLRELRAAGFQVFGAAAAGGQFALTREGQKSPRVLVLGNEEYGLAPEVAAACTQLLTIPSRGRIESLNVSVAGAVLLWELFAKKS